MPGIIRGPSDVNHCFGPHTWPKLASPSAWRRRCGPRATRSGGAAASFLVACNRTHERLATMAFLRVVAAFSCLKNRLEKHLAEPCNRADEQRMFGHPWR